MLEIQKKLSNSFLALLSLPATAMGFALSVQISALSWILSTKYGLDIHDVGLVWAAGPIAGIIGQVTIGAISDNVWFWGGRRRPFILIGGLLAALMLLALPSIDVISTALGFDGVLGVAIVIALTLDLAINVSFNPTRSVIADVTDSGNRTRGYTWMQTISGTFGVLAYAIGAVFNNYVLIYFGAGLVFLFSIIPTLFIEEPKEFAEEADANSNNKLDWNELFKTIQPLWGFFLYAIYAMYVRLAGIKLDTYYVELALFAFTLGLMSFTLFRDESTESVEKASRIGFQKILAAHSFTWLGVQTMFVYMFAYLQYSMPNLTDMELGSVIAYSFLMFNAVAAVLPAFVLEPMSRKFGKINTHTACIGVTALAYAGLIFYGSTPLIVYLWMSLAGIGWAATVSLPFAIMSEKVKSNKMGLYMGLFNLSVVLPQLVASLGIGEVISNAPDKTIIFVISAASLAVSALAWMPIKEGKKDNGEDLEFTQMPAGGGH